MLRGSPAFDKFQKDLSDWLRSPYLGLHPSSALHPLDSRALSHLCAPLRCSSARSVPPAEGAHELQDEMDVHYRAVFTELQANLDYASISIGLFTRAYELFKVRLVYRRVDSRSSFPVRIPSTLAT